MRNIFIEKLCPKDGEQANPTAFSKKSELSLFPDKQSEML